MKVVCAEKIACICVACNQINYIWVYELYMQPAGR